MELHGVNTTVGTVKKTVELGFSGLGFLDCSLDGFFATLTFTIQFFLTFVLLVACHYGLLDISADKGFSLLRAALHIPIINALSTPANLDFPLTRPTRMSIFPIQDINPMKDYSNDSKRECEKCGQGRP